MKTTRTYGRPPYRVAVIHGGPGAAGEMAPVARELSSVSGVLEPLQTAASLEGQIQELHDVLTDKGDPPLVLIGWSWGAWLVFITAARYPTLAAKLILVGSGPFDEESAAGIMETRLGRLNGKEAAQVISLVDSLNDPSTGDKDFLLAKLGKLVSKADSCNPFEHEDDLIEYDYKIFFNVWGQAAELRRNGVLLELGREIRCPVVAVHGDYDPHPAERVREPLSRTLADFRFILLENCGHKPWIEKAAKVEFYEIMREVLP